MAQKLTIKQTGTRDITGPAIGDDAVRSTAVTAALTIAPGPYAKGGLPITAKQLGLKQLRELQVQPDPDTPYSFGFEWPEPEQEPDPYRVTKTPEPVRTHGQLLVFQGAEVEDGRVLPEITTEVTVEGV